MEITLYALAYCTHASDKLFCQLYRSSHSSACSAIEKIVNKGISDLKRNTPDMMERYLSAPKSAQ